MKIIRDGLTGRRFHTLRVMVAFLKTSGVRPLLPDLRQFVSNGGKLDFIVGTDFAATEASAIRLVQRIQSRWPTQINIQLVRMKGFASFHPKLYWFQGERDHWMLIGSSNFTGGGLQNNVELSLFLQVATLSVGEDRRAVRDLGNTWDEIIESCVGEGWASLLEPTEKILSRMEREAEKARRHSAQIPRNPIPASDVAEQKQWVRPERVLIMDLTEEQGGPRRSQVQPPKPVWENYFGVDPARQELELSLTNERTGRRYRRPKVPHHHNWTIEIAGAEAQGDRIIRFARTGPRKYSYSVFRRGEAEYKELDRILRKVRRWRGRARRVWPEQIMFPVS